MNRRARDNGVEQLLIMVDLEGSLATLDEVARKRAVENHYKWVHAARYLGCHSIRVNAAGKGDRQAVLSVAVDSLGRLADYAEKEGINVVVENHGGYSSDASWLAEVMRQVGRPNCGTLPDFGNFTMSLFPYQTYDRYQGVQELMPFAKGVSAKTFAFDSSGREKSMDFQRLLSIIRESGYTGHIGIEYEGYKLSEPAGILATKRLLIEAGGKMG
jgi:sugar phosphate isomerase/epimerase